MIKNLGQLKREQRKILKIICSGDKERVVSILNPDMPLALHECIKNGFVENIDEWKDGNGNYHFERIGHVMVTGEGLKFIKDTSFVTSFVHLVFKILKGTLGFIIGVISTVIAAYLVWKFGWNN